MRGRGPPGRVEGKHMPQHTSQRSPASPRWRNRTCKENAVCISGQERVRLAQACCRQQACPGVVLAAETFCTYASGETLPLRTGRPTVRSMPRLAVCSLVPAALTTVATPHPLRPLPPCPRRVPLPRSTLVPYVRSIVELSEHLLKVVEVTCVCERAFRPTNVLAAGSSKAKRPTP